MSTTPEQITDMMSSYTSLKQYYEGARSDIQNQLNQWGINGYTTLNVGVDKPFSSIQDAWNSLQGKKLAAGVLIKVDDGMYELNGLYLENHPDAHQIRIEGNSATPASCTLKFVPDNSGKSHGVILRNVKRLNFSGFRLQGTLGETYRGMHVAELAVVSCDTDSIIIENCDRGIEVYSNAYLYAHGLSTIGCSYGATIGSGGNADLRGFNAVGTGKTNPGIGLDVVDNAKCWAFEAETSNFDWGFHADKGAYLWCDSAKADNCRRGFFAAIGGVLWSHDNPGTVIGRALATNCEHGFIAESSGSLYIPVAKAESCGTGFYCSQSSFIQAANSAVINCSATGYYASAMGLIEAYGSSAKAVGTSTVYSPASHAVLGNDNAMIRRS